MMSYDEVVIRRISLLLRAIADHDHRCRIEADASSASLQRRVQVGFGLVRVL